MLNTKSLTTIFTVALLALPLNVQSMERTGRSFQNTSLTRYAAPIIATALIIGGGATYALWKLAFPKPQFTIDQFLKNPEALRVEAEKIDSCQLTERAFDDASSVENAVAAFKKHAQNMSAKLPICFLGECSAEGFFPCILNRKTNPQYRKKFEDLVSTALVEKIAASPEPVVYTTFGPGGMFQDFVILVKTLAQKPDAKLHINLIDRQYWLYVDCLHKLNQPRTVGTEPIDISSIKKDLILDARKDSSLAKKSDDEIERLLWQITLQNEVRFQQFITGLNTLFPKASISLLVHESATGYEQYRKTTQPPTTADVLVAADIEDDMCLMSNAPYSYTALCAAAFKLKPTAQAIYLSKDRTTNTAHITTFSSDPSHGKKIELKDGSIIYGKESEKLA